MWTVPKRGLVFEPFWSRNVYLIDFNHFYSKTGCVYMPCNSEMWLKKEWNTARCSENEDGFFFKPNIGHFLCIFFKVISNFFVFIFLLMPWVLVQKLHNLSSVRTRIGKPEPLPKFQGVPPWTLGFLRSVVSAREIPKTAGIHYSEQKTPPYATLP